MKVLAMDMGGTFIKWAICNVTPKQIKLLKKGRFRTSEKEYPTGNQVFTNMAKFASQQIKLHRDIECVCSTIGGIVDTDNYKVLSVSPTYKDYPKSDIKGIFSKYVNLPFYIINDVRSGALGEIRYGCLKKTKNKNSIFLAIGTGIMCAPIINNKLYMGSGYASGEIGPMVINNHYYENHYKLPALIKRCQEIDKSIVTAEDCLDKMHHNKLIKNIIDAWFVGLIEGVATLCYAFNPEYFIFGGKITEHKFFDLKVFKKIMLKNARQPLLSSIMDVKFVKAELGNDAALFGAASLALDKNYKL